MSQEYLFDILENDPKNIDIMEKTLYEIKNTLFDNMCIAEKAITDIHRFDMTMDNYLTRTSHRCTYSIPVSMITESYRNKFRVSEFYKKDISIRNILSNPDIFYLTLFIFINGELYTNASFTVNLEESVTLLSFNLYSDFYEDPPYIKPGFSQNEMNTFIDNHTSMTILSIPNCQVDEFNTTRNNLYRLTNETMNLGLSIVDFTNLSERIIDDNNEYCTFTTKDDSYLYKYSYMNTTNDEDHVFFDPTEIDALTNSYTYSKFIKFRNLLTKIDIPSENDFFTIPLQNFPIPVNNIILFKRTNEGIKFDHLATLTMYYPNFYEIHKTHNDDLIAFVFYKDDTIYGLNHKDELRLYHRFTENVLSKYCDNTIPSMIKNYVPISTTYGMEDFAYQQLDALHYKINSLIELIQQDGDFYKIYLNKLIGYVPSFYINVSEIEDLQTRYRTDTSIENPNNVITFEEPCYVFIIRNENKATHHVLTVDTLVFVPKYKIETAHIIYIYIPVSIVNSNTIINIKKYYDSVYSKEIIATSTSQYINLDINSNNHLSAQDIFVTKLHQYVDDESFEIYTKLPDNTYKQIIYDKFYVYDNLYIKIIDDNLLNTTLLINSSRKNFIQTVYNNSRFQLFNINQYINNDRKNVRLFKNGQLLPITGYKVRFNENAGGPHVIRGLTSIYNNDIFTLSYTNSKYHLLYEERLIHESGVVNLHGLINKPIDLNWMDIYINGLKLTNNELDILGPYMLVVKNVNTRKNFQIYQIDLDEDANINIDQNSDDITEKLYNDLEELQNAILSENGPIEDTMPDIYADIYSDYIGLLEDIVWDIPFLNPDTQQITEEMIDMYPELLDAHHNYFINPDQLFFSPFNIYINPDNGVIEYRPLD